MQSQVDIRNNAMSAQDILNDFISWQAEQKKTDEALRQEAASHTSGEAAPSINPETRLDASQVSRYNLKHPCDAFLQVCMIRIWIINVQSRLCPSQKLLSQRHNAVVAEIAAPARHGAGLPQDLQLRLHRLKNLWEPSHLPALLQYLQRKPTRAMEVTLHPIRTTVPPDVGRALMWMRPWQSSPMMRPTRAAHQDYSCR